MITVCECCISCINCAADDIGILLMGHCLSIPVLAAVFGDLEVPALCLLVKTWCFWSWCISSWSEQTVYLYLCWRTSLCPWTWGYLRKEAVMYCRIGPEAKMTKMDIELYLEQTCQNPRIYQKIWKPWLKWRKWGVLGFFSVPAALHSLHSVLPSGDLWMSCLHSLSWYMCSVPLLWHLTPLMFLRA